MDIFVTGTLKLPPCIVTFILLEHFIAWFQFRSSLLNALLALTLIESSSTIPYQKLFSKYFAFLIKMKRKL